jgi:hypothetical protein
VATSGQGGSVPRLRIDLPATSHSIKVYGGLWHADPLPDDAMGPAVFELDVVPEYAVRASAVEVFHDGQPVGHFWPDATSEYERIIDALRQAEWQVWAQGRIDRDASGRNQVTVYLPHPAELERWLAAPSSARGSVSVKRNAVAIERTRVFLKRVGPRQADIAGILDGRTEAVVSASVIVRPTSSGKYEGQAGLVFYVGSVPIGELPAQYQSEAPDIFDLVLSGTVTIEVDLFRRRDADEYGAVVYLLH